MANERLVNSSAADYSSGVFLPKRFVPQSAAYGLLELAGERYAAWKMQEFSKSDSGSLRDIFIGGVQGMGKSTLASQIADDWSLSKQDHEYLWLTTGNGIKLAKDWGLVKNGLGNMSAQEYWAADLALVMLNSLAKKHLSGPGWIINEFVMVTGMPVPGEISQDDTGMMGVSRGTRAAEALIRQDPLSSMILIHGDLSISRRTMDYRQCILAATTQQEVARINARFGVIDERPWEELISFYKQTANAAALEHGRVDMRKLLYKLIETDQILDDDYADEAEFGAILDQNPELEQSLVLGDLFPLLVNRLYRNWLPRVGKRSLSPDWILKDQVLIMQNRPKDMPQKTGGSRLMPVREALVNKAKFDLSLREVMLRTRIATPADFTL